MWQCGLFLIDMIGFETIWRVLYNDYSLLLG